MAWKRLYGERLSVGSWASSTWQLHNDSWAAWTPHSPPPWTDVISPLQSYIVLHPHAYTIYYVTRLYVHSIGAKENGRVAFRGPFWGVLFCWHELFDIDESPFGNPHEKDPCVMCVAVGVQPLGKHRVWNVDRWMMHTLDKAHLCFHGVHISQIFPWYELCVLEGRLGIIMEHARVY